MAETAAHLVDQVFPKAPVRQWVFSLPKRLRFYVHRDVELAGSVLHIWLRAVERALRRRSPGAPATARFEAVSFIHRFGSELNAHTHYHCCIIDGVFSQRDDGALCFHEATALDEADVVTVQAKVRRRVLRLFERRGLLSPETVAAMGQWAHAGGFSVDASVRVEAQDRAGLERLLRYCARPVFASERLARVGEGEQLIYRLAKPRPDGRCKVSLTPLELLDRLAALIPPPRRHRHTYHGVLAPNAALRSLVTGWAGRALPAPGEGAGPPAGVAVPDQDHRDKTTSPRPPSSYLWATLLARIYECCPLVCPDCGHEMRVIAFVTEPNSVKALLQHLGLPTEPPPVAPARGPPLEDAAIEQRPEVELGAPEPIPQYEFDQRVSW
jgi:hypothetical protein